MRSARFVILFMLCVPIAECPMVVTSSARAGVIRPASNDSALGTLGTYVTKAPDTLLDVARSYDLGFTQLMAANPGVNAWVPGTGRRITIPGSYLLPSAPRRGIVINLAEQRLFYFRPGERAVVTFPIGVGVQAASTPLGTTRVVEKEPEPTWYPPASIRSEETGLPKAVKPGPDDPLGSYALHLGWPDYLIHGTNKPDGVGRNVSHGCIRLYPEDIAKLYREVRIGTPVMVVDQPVEIAWIGDELYLEIHPDAVQSNEIDIDGSFEPAIPPHLDDLVAKAAGNQLGRINWAAVDRAARERSGIPVRITDTSEFPGPSHGAKFKGPAATG